MYNYHRFYDPAIGRYFRADPIGMKGGINLFTYSFNNPSNQIDPFGLETWWGQSVEVDVAFILFFGYSKVIGSISNQGTGETCTYETKCKKVGFGIMLADVSGSGNAAFNGPACGKDLAGLSVGITVDAGPFGPAAGAISVDSNAAVYVSVGLGGGPIPGSGSIGGMVCKTKIISCNNTSCECKEK